MAENSAISWTDHTFNPWWGCTKVGPGCDHCYAETFDRRVGGDHWGSGKPRRLIKDWSAPRKWNREAERTGVRPWVFCASMADVLDNEVPSEWRARLWLLIYETQHLNWIIVTKRIGNAAKMLPVHFVRDYPHVGICSTIVNQEEADRDIPKLLATPAAWRGVSAEPLLGPIDFSSLREGTFDALTGCGDRERIGEWEDTPRLDWIIVGGESGAHARPMHPDWARSIRDQCAASGVSFHFKQWGEFEIAVDRERDDPDWRRDYARDLAHGGRGGRHHWLNLAGGQGFHGEAFHVMRRVGKKHAGRLLDGVEHNGMPLPVPGWRVPEGFEPAGGR